MKLLKRLFFYLLLIVGVLLVASGVSVYLYKDQIIQRFITEANKNLNTPVKIGKIDISMWSDFPNLAIEFTDVYIEDSHPGNYPLLTAKMVSFFLNPVEVWQGKYSIRGLQIMGSETNLKINKNGLANYIILKENKGGSGGSSIVFDLRNVRLQDSHVIYRDVRRVQEHMFNSGKLVASIHANADVYKIQAKGDVTTEKIGVQSNTFLQMKRFEVSADLLYDDREKNLTINPSQLDLHSAMFELSGTYAFKEKNLIDIHCDGKNTDIQTLLSLLPENTSSKVSKYESDGDVYFNLDVKGEISKRTDPSISVRFGCTNTTLYHPDYKSRIENANLEGSFASPSPVNVADAVLFLKNVSGTLNGRPFQTDLSIQNFENPYVSFVFKGDLEAASITNFYPIDYLNELSGDIGIDVSFEGQTALLKKKSTAQQVTANGSIEMRHLDFKYGSQKIQFVDLNGSLQFTNNDLALSNVVGKLENSHFQLNGFFKNIITFLLFENQPIGIETDLKSDFIDLDQLFEIGFGKQGSTDYNFSISPNLYLNFNCDVKSMHYKKFKPSNITGNLLIKSQTAAARNIEFRAMGGSLSLNGIVDAKNNKAIDVISSFKVSGINIDSAFYVFENFQQDFIQDKHLKGKAFADVELEMTLNEKLGLYQETLVANISTTIRDGELTNFEPLHKLDRYLDDDGLNHLRFADLKNNIHIENKTVYIPQMEVRSNVTNIQISGTHTFDQHIDYRVVAPLRSRKKIDPDEAFGAIEDSQTGQAKIFLKIIGTTDDYKVIYDKDAVKKKIVNDLKKEVQELKDAFKLKGKIKKKELELEEDDYFEWVDSTKVNNKGRL
ncbi:MAG: AsmA-like C-terminal region-containing protein [Cyclobacteriaceae bacterium]